MTIKRREFLGTVAAGSAVLTMPGFLSGCGIQSAMGIGGKTPENPFMEWFGVDQPTVARVMSELTARGADAADVYFQHSRSNSLTLEDGIVSSANSRIRQGVGLRVVIGEQTGYAFTEDLTLPSMLAAARTASAIASGSQVVAPQSFNPSSAGDLYTTTVPWANVGIDQKLPILKMVEAKTKAKDPAIDKVAVFWADGTGVMSELTARGADAADVYFQHSRSNSLTLEDGIVSSANSRIRQGVGLRVVIGEQTGYAFTEDLTLPSMLAAARTASAIASGSQVVAPQSFNPSSAGDLYTTTVPWANVGIDQKLPILKMVEAKTKAKDPAIDKVAVFWADGDERVMIATLDGRLVMDHRPMTRVTVVATAKKGDETQTGYSNIAAREEISWYTEERLNRMVDEAVERTMIQFEARRPPAGEMPVILASGASGILLHEAIGHGMEADFNRKGTSIYTDMMGKKVAEPFVTVVDQADIPNERGALNFDDEGNKAGRTVMVEDGILKSYLHDQISAQQYGLKPTGSGRRESYRFAPMPRMTCTFMEDGPHTKDEIIAAVDHGIICETYTNGQVQIGAGDFTFYVKNGWLVEKGKVTAPIKDVNIIGNGPEALKRITMVANDARLDTGGWTCGKNGQSVPVSQGIPTVLVSNMTVGGENVS